MQGCNLQISKEILCTCGDGRSTLHLRMDIGLLRGLNTYPGRSVAGCMIPHELSDAAWPDIRLEKVLRLEGHPHSPVVATVHAFGPIE